jgi:hypothetical protein
VKADYHSPACRRHAGIYFGSSAGARPLFVSPLQNKVPFLPFLTANHTSASSLLSPTTTTHFSSPQPLTFLHHNQTTTTTHQQEIYIFQSDINNTMAGGKGKSIGGKGSGAKDSGSKSQKSHSAKAGLQVCLPSVVHHHCLIEATLHSRSSTPSISDISLPHAKASRRVVQNMRLR